MTRHPVLLLPFRRPEQVARVAAAIRAANPPAVYVSFDGPRAGNAEEAVLVERARQVVRDTLASGPPVHIREHATNLGPKRAIQGALDWFFSEVEAGIVLEDDCLPDPSFFPYVDELLDRYRDDPRVATICGSNPHLAPVAPGEDSYHFSRFPRVWGWATWRRTWERYDHDLDTWPAYRDAGRLHEATDTEAARRFWRRVLNGCRHGRIDTWDWQLAYSIFRDGGLNVVPRHNLVANIGIGPGSANMTDPDGEHRARPARTIDFPLVHPVEVVRHVEADHIDELADFQATRWQALRHGVGARLRGYD